MSDLVTLSDARVHLQGSGLTDDNLTAMIARAESALWEFLGYDDLADFYYEEGDQPTPVLQFAVLLILTQMHDDRTGAPITEAVKATVRRYRNPVLA